VESLNLSPEAMAALDQLQSEVGQLKSVSSLRRTTKPASELEQLFGVLLRLLGQDGIDWRHARSSLAHPKELFKRMDKLKDMVIVGHAPWRNFDTAHQVRQQWIEDYGSIDGYFERISKINQEALVVARWVVAMIQFYDVLNLRNVTAQPQQEAATPPAVLALEAKLESVGEQQCKALLATMHAAEFDVTVEPSSWPTTVTQPIEVVHGLLLLLGQDPHGWEQTKHVLGHWDQLKIALNMLSHMVAAGEAPGENFSNAQSTVGSWRASGFAETDSLDPMLKIMCEWASDIYEYWQSTK